ncbi:hypothetical protein GE09DRAFT_954754 [Coniochaeta sp. 2T2.1]|nr:hypothetical protein GE09DRAFT_954754 [Coniochaeta sp. 2T2.1]
MLSKKLLLVLPFALQALANPWPNEGTYLITRVCVPPSNCGGPVGSCEFCCGSARPNSNTCHEHGGRCPDGSPEWHCDDTTF